SKDQRRLSAVQIGDLALEQQMHVTVARNVAGATGAGAGSPQGLLHRREHSRVLPHAEIVVRAPDGDLGADAVIKGSRKPAAAALKIGEDAVPPLGAERVETLFKKAFVIHGY